MPDFIEDMSAHIQAHCETDPLWADTLSMAALCAVLKGLNFNTIYGPLQLNVYALCIGPSGLANKTIPMKNYVTPILEKAGSIADEKEDFFILPSRFSLEGFINHLSEKSSSGIILNDEFTHVLKEAYGAGYLSEILEFLSELYDGTAQKRATKKAGLEHARKVFVNFVSATTPYIYEVMKAEMFLQGTANRFLFVIFKNPVEKKYTPESFFVREDETQQADYMNDQFGTALGELHRAIRRGTYVLGINTEDDSGKLLLEYRESCQKTARQLYAERRPRDFVYSYLVRQPEIAFKLAAIKAISENYKSFFQGSGLREILISERQAQWAIARMKLYEENFMRMQEEWAKHNIEKETVKTLDNFQDQVIGYLKNAGGAILLKELQIKMRVRDASLRDTLNTMGTVDTMPGPDYPSDSQRYRDLLAKLKPSYRTGAPPTIVALKQTQPKK